MSGGVPAGGFQAEAEAAVGAFVASRPEYSIDPSQPAYRVLRGSATVAAWSGAG